MKTQVSILTSTAQDTVEQGVSDYQNAVAAHIGGDWGVHNQFCFYGTLNYAEPATGHTITNGRLMRVQLSGNLTDGTPYDGVYAFPAIYNGGSVIVIGNVPAILIQPVSQSVATGATALMSVVAASATSMTYQWYFGGAAISGATSSVYVSGAVAASAAGSYYVVVTNAYGFTKSSIITLSVT